MKPSNLISCIVIYKDRKWVSGDGKIIMLYQYNYFPGTKMFYKRFGLFGGPWQFAKHDKIEGAINDARYFKELKY